MARGVASALGATVRPRGRSVKSPPSERRPIRRLPPEAVEKIAAGEVVEGPSSVVKELIENAIDAGATEVEVRLEGGGLERIVVADDGAGIPADQLELAVERHATSKLTGSPELAQITSLGFRGEALAAIAQVSRFRLLSRTPDAPSAHGLVLEGGRTPSTFEAGRSVGTTVDVWDLFFNTPARRKFLRSPAAEQVETLATVERIYLAHPSIAITVASGGQEIAQYPRALNLEEASSWVFGTDFVSSHFTVRSGSDSPVQFVGALGRPTVTRGTSVGVQISVNGRAVQSRPLAQAVRVAYQDYLPRTRFPVGAVQLVLDPARVDVNVHPTKREVRIQGEREVADALRRAIRVALVGGPQVADVGVPRSRDRRPIAGAASVAIPPVPGSLAAPGAAPSKQTFLVGHPREQRVAGTHRHPALALLGSLFRLYWVAESDGDLVLIDQHAASERILYDELRAAGRLGRQELMEPVRVALTPRQRSALAANAEMIRASGFTVEAFGRDQFRVGSVPSYRGHRAEATALPSLLDELADGGRPTVPDGMVERVAASVACHAAVRAGDETSAEEIGRILEALYRTDTTAYACPHGRPVLVRLTRSRIDGWFLRRAP
jgi:DNA mismatch repair protein MutL